MVSSLVPASGFMVQGALRIACSKDNAIVSASAGGVTPHPDKLRPGPIADTNPAHTSPPISGSAAPRPGVGFLSWVAVIDDVRGRLPFVSSSGVVFHDGELRDLPAAQAMQAFAREDGVLPFELAPLNEKRDLTGRVEPSFPPGRGIDDALYDLHPLRWPPPPAPRLRQLLDRWLRAAARAARQHVVVRVGRVRCCSRGREADLGRS